MENSLDKENEAVAQLIYHAAISVNSLFFPQGTGAYDIDIPPALIDNFRYNESAEFIFKHQYAGNWEELIINELNQNRPLIYGAIDLDNSVGHTFVCDGYQDENYFHFNWGWGGQYNGYFYLDSLIVAGYHYDYQHDVVIGIRPDISGIVELYPPESLIAEVDFHDVHLSWDPPSITGTLDLLGYQVFRNDTALNSSIVTVTSFTDENAPSGTHIYKVKSSYSGQGNGPATETEVYISGIDDNFRTHFQVYPNPNNGSFQVRMETLQFKTDLHIFDIQGRIVFQKEIAAGLAESTFTFNNFPEGIYLIQFKSHGNVKSIKIVVY
jgi:hypothetical protein